MLKIGDRVRIIYGLMSRDVGRITGCDGIMYTVLFDSGYKYLYFANEIERVA